MAAHEDAFLLLPGDGLLLVAPTGEITHSGRECRAIAGDGCPAVGQDISEHWPELATHLAAFEARDPALGHLDVHATRAGRDVLVRIFRTDDGLGLGLINPDPDRGLTGPAFVLYDRVLRSLAEVVVITTAEPIGRPGPVIVYVNDAFVEHVGYARHEALGRSPRFLQGPATDAAARRAMGEDLAAWRSGEAQLLNYRKDGEPFWVSIAFAPVADETGWFTHWVSVQSDITDRMRAEADRRARDTLIQAILDSLPAQSALLDESGRIIATNAAWRGIWTSMSGLPEPDWVGQDYLEVCRRAGSTDLPGAEEARSAAAGIEAVLEGRQPSFGMDYSMDAMGEGHWFHMEVMPLRSASGVVVTHVDVSRQARVESDLGYQASHDTLTGLPNREALLERLEELRDDADRGASPFGLVVLDLDDLKVTNDALGHLYGDRVLKEVAIRLECLLEPGDMAARVSGDEFAVIKANVTDSWDYGSYCEQIRTALAEPIDLDLTQVRLSASYGVVMSGVHSGPADDLLRDADTAMHVAKNAGRNRWTLFDAEHRDVARARVISMDRIRLALDRDEFVLHFQPFIDLSTGRTVASEALLRWQHPEDGLLFPGSFLGALETGILIEDVGTWVLNAALATQARWQQMPGFEDHLMSVNVSPRQLGTGRLPSVIAEALDRHQVAPERLGIEVLESSLMTAGSLVEEELRAIHDMGVRIAIDDFGTGYSALAYLQDFPVDGVKLDRAFVNRSTTERGAGLVRAIREIAAAIGAIAVAEGIENPAELAAVRQAGVHWGQGYLLGRPVAAAGTPSPSQHPVA